MKITFALLGVAIGLCTSGCYTTHRVENGTVHVAKETGHAVGHATEKVGDSISHGGQKLQDKTDQ